jgi:hypothetical protein
MIQMNEIELTIKLNTLMRMWRKCIHESKIGTNDSRKVTFAMKADSIEEKIYQLMGLAKRDE